jgi:hypothetical protein
MSIWRIEPKEQNKVTEIQTWYKDYNKLVRKEQFAYCSFLSDNPDQPVMNLNNPSGIELTKGTPYNWSLEKLHQRDNGPWVTWEFPVEMTVEEQNRITNLIDLNMYLGLESDGWAHSGVEYWVYGNLILTKVR